MEIREADNSDIESIANIYKTCFPRERNHDLWIRSSLRAYPRGVYYVMTVDGDTCGYILWCVKNGFRPESIVELEQVAIHPDFAGRGLGRELIETSIDRFKGHVEALGHSIGAILVTTSDGNFAEGLYESTLGVSRSATIANYGSGTEVILYKCGVV